MQDWKTWDQIARVENAGLENAGPNLQGWKRQDWKTGEHRMLLTRIVHAWHDQQYNWSRFSGVMGGYNTPDTVVTERCIALSLS